MWIAGIAGAILFVAIGTTGIILGGGDSGSVSATATSGAPTTSTAPVTSSVPPAAATPAPGVPALPPETVTTVTPTAETTARTAGACRAPRRLPPRRAPSPTA